MAPISEDHKAIGLKIANLRCQRGMAQEDLGVALGIGRQSVGDIEHGTVDFRISRLISICDAFSVAPSEVLPDRLAEKNRLNREMQKLEEKLLRMTPYQQSECLKALSSMVDSFSHVANQ